MSKQITLLSILFCISTAGAARAAEPAPAAAEPQMPWEKACESDMKTLCAAEKGDVRACLAEHEKELSKQCTKHFSAAGYRVALVCDKDFDRLCKKEAEAGDLAKCVNAKVAQLSPKCRAAITKPAPAAEAKPAADPPVEVVKRKKKAK